MHYAQNGIPVFVRTNKVQSGRAILDRCVQQAEDYNESCRYYRRLAAKFGTRVKRPAALAALLVPTGYQVTIVAATPQRCALLRPRGAVLH